MPYGYALGVVGQVFVSSILPAPIDCIFVARHGHLKCGTHPRCRRCPYKNNYG